MKNAAKVFGSTISKNAHREIRSLAPTLIDDFIAELWQLEAEMRSAVRTEVRDTKRVDGPATTVIDSSLISKQSGNALQRFAKQETSRESQMEPIPEGEILAKLEISKADLPSSEEVEVTLIPSPDSSETSACELIACAKET